MQASCTSDAACVFIVPPVGEYHTLKTSKGMLLVMVHKLLHLTFVIVPE